MIVKLRRRANKRWHVVEAYENAPRIDEVNGIIYNVLILGRKARNKRHYTEEAMEDAVTRGIYDELQVYIGPHKKSRFAKRSPHDHAGELRNIRRSPDGVRGDLHYNRASKGGKLALELAKRFPKRFGLSHHADVAGYEENGEKYITRILEATVADIVKDAATTDGVFEDVETPKKGKKQPLQEEAGEEGEVEVETEAEDDSAGGGWAGSLKKLIAEIHDDDNLEDDVKMKATKAAMKLKQLLNGDGGGSDEESDEDEGDAEEGVDIAKVVRKEISRALKNHKPQQVLAPRKSTIKPRSTARTEATEDVTPAKKPTPAALSAKLSKPEDIIAAYEED